MNPTIDVSQLPLRDIHLPGPVGWWPPAIGWWLVAALVLVAFGAVVTVRERTRAEAAWLLVPPMFLLYVLSFHYGKNYGIRYLLPAFPFLLLLAGRGVDALLRAGPAGLPVVGVLLAWQLASAALALPHHLAYFNELAGGPDRARRLLLDSNLDWGQDLKRLGIWVDEHGLKKISLDYFGWSNPTYYLGDKAIWTSVGQWRDARDFLRRNQSNGWIAISGTFLQEAQHRTNQDNGGYRWLLNYEPVTVVGHSIFVFHITQ